MNQTERAGVIKLAAAAGILYLFVTGKLATLVSQLTGGISGAPVAEPYKFRDLVASSLRPKPVLPGHEAGPAMARP